MKYIKEFIKGHCIILWMIYKKIVYLRWKKIVLRGVGFLKNNMKYILHEPTVYIVTSPNYGNLGDHSIALAEIAVAKHYFPEHRLVDISDDQYCENIWCLAKYANKQDYIFLMGGGNFGTMYPSIEYIRRDTIKLCKNTPVIMFPQSFNYKEDRYNEIELNKSMKLYSRNHNLHLIFRDEVSFNSAFLFKNKSYFLPDVVLTLKPFVDCSYYNRNEIGICLRNDQEKQISDMAITRVIKKLKMDKFKLDEFDTDLGCVYISKEERYEKVKELMKRISSKRFIITDRLHGLIIAQICGVPCLVFDNINGKIKNVCEYLEPNTYVWCQDEVENAINKIYDLTHFNLNIDSYLEKYDIFFARIKKNG
ncbi:MAG: polysaccharide pyruvyl transferase family protein [Lachnospiraceae bacterium]|nr:polysaccharide pyruvyl transferase family protein [Lachnospiraceae bacterium]